MEKGILSARSAAGKDISGVFPGAVDLSPENFDGVGDLGVLANRLFDPLDRVENGGVVPVPVEPADLGQGKRGDLPGQVDRDMPGRGGVPVPAAGLEGVSVSPVMGGNRATDRLRGDLDGRSRFSRGKDLGDQLGGDRSGGQRRFGNRAGQCSPELTEVGLHPAGQQGKGVLIGYLESGFGNQVAKNGEACSQVRRFDRHREAPFETVAEPVGEGRDLAWRAVSGKNDLAACVMQGIEGVEELFLGVGLAGDELDVIDQQYVEIAVAPFELVGSLVAEGGDEFGGEGLGVRIEDVQLGNVKSLLVGDRTEQVGLAEAGRTVQEERVV